MIGIILIIDIILPYIAQYFVPGFSEYQMTQYIFYTRVLMMQPLLLGISALISCIAQARHRFILYSTVPLIYTTSIIFGIIFGYPTKGLIGIIYGVIIGAVLHVTLQSYTLYKEGISIHYSKFSLDTIKEHLHLAIPRSGSIVVSQMRTVFFTAFATSLGAGVLSIYLFAQKIIDAIVQILAQSLSTASLPALSTFYSANDIPSYTRSIKRHSMSLFSIGIIFSLVCFLFSKEIVYILYGTTNGNTEIANMLRTLSLGIPFFALAWYLTYAFSAMKDTRSTLYANIISTLISMVICFIAKDRGLGMMSIAIGVISVNFLSALLMILVYKLKRLHRHHI
jgi:putative peptidoglycan lipid II flippase